MFGSACLFVCHASWAGTVEVSPVIASLSARHPIQAFTVRNEGQSPVTVQIALMTWSQQAGRDVLAPTDDLLSTPPLFAVAPGQSQIVRVGMRHATSQNTEVAYRMFLTEVPPPPEPGFRGLAVTLRLSIPVFVKPAKPVSPTLTWRVTPSANGGAIVEAANSGSVHIKILSLSLLDKETKGSMRQSASSYVLANNHYRWGFASFHAVHPGDHVTIDAKTDIGDISTAVVVQPESNDDGTAR